MKSNIQEPKGILNPQNVQKKFQIARYLPQPKIANFVDRYWIVRWDLREQEPYRQETLPYPCVNLVIEEGRSGIFGVITKKFTRYLTDHGRVVGIKFRPGAFYPFVDTAVSNLTNKVWPLEQVFGADGQTFAETILALADDGQIVAEIESFLGQRLPQKDENVEKINEIIDYITAERTVTKVSDVTEQFAMSKRTLQRLFQQYVGAPPKWVIQRTRLHEVAAQLADEAVENWPMMALDLGYFDQAHLIKDFKAVIGISPGEYIRHINSDS